MFGFFVKFYSEISLIVLVFQKNIIAGSRSKLKGLPSCTHPLQKGRGTATQKGMPFCFFFSWAHALRRIWNKYIEKYLKEYLHLSLLWGTVQCTIDRSSCLTSIEKITPLIFQNFCSLLRNHIHLPLKTWSACACITTWSSGTSSFHAPSSVRWTMTLSCIFYLLLPLINFSFFSCIK